MFFPENTDWARVCWILSLSVSHKVSRFIRFCSQCIQVQTMGGFGLVASLCAKFSVQWIIYSPEPKTKKKKEREGERERKGKMKNKPNCITPWWDDWIFNFSIECLCILTWTGNSGQSICYPDRGSWSFSVLLLLFIPFVFLNVFKKRSFKCTQKGNTAVSLFETVLESGMFLLVGG